MDRAIIIDGHSLLHRAFYALPILTNSKGVYTNAVYGFLNMFYKIAEDYQPRYLAVAFDRHAPTFRHLEYEAYKAGRRQMPDEMRPQVELLKETLTVMGITIYELDGFEADDLMGAFGVRAQAQGVAALLVTGDRDALQLIGPNVHVLMNQKGISQTIEYDEAQLMERYSLTPQQIPDLKGLMGDSSDNIPGIPGVGEKTALKLLAAYGTLEEALAHAQEVSGPKLRQSLVDFADQARLSRHLATIVTDVPLQMDLEQCRYRTPHGPDVAALFAELEFKSLVARVGGTVQEEVPPRAEINIEEVQDEAQLAQAVVKMQDSPRLAVMLDETFSLSDGQTLWRIPIQRTLLPGGLSEDSALAAIQPVLANPAIKKILHDAKAQAKSLQNVGIGLEGIWFDTMVAAYLIDATAAKYELTALCAQYRVPVDETPDAGALWLLQEHLGQRLDDLTMRQLLDEMEMPLLLVLRDIEREGFRVDRAQLDEVGLMFNQRLQELTELIYQHAERTDFNINSTKQLGQVLFEQLRLPVVKKTKTGYSTDIEVLEELQERHPIITPLIEYRQLTKLKGTYVDGLLPLIGTDNRIHTTLHQTVTATGRISSSEPNLQNIPVRMELAQVIRKAFIPSDPEHILVDADYSQIELRILAHISGDRRMIEAFNQGADIHRSTAAAVFDVPMEAVTPAMRGNAKAVNFGIVYGISDFGLAKNTGLTRREAAEFIERYFSTYPGVQEYMKNIIKFARDHGYVQTLFGRRRALPELSSGNFNVRSFGERVAMNMPIQGTAADIIKMAMIKVHERLKAQTRDSQLILQVHDELIVNAHRDEASQVEAICREEMEAVIRMEVPLLADVHRGENWYDAKG